MMITFSNDDIVDMHNISVMMNVTWISFKYIPR